MGTDEWRGEMGVSAMKARLQEIERGLVGVGYSREGLVWDYEFVAGPNRVRKAELVAFGNVYRKDLATSCIAVKWCQNGESRREWLQDLSCVAAPLVLISTPDLVELWPVRMVEPMQRPYEKLGYGRLQQYFSENRIRLAPETLMAAKRGERQLSFLHVDPSLVEFAYDVTKKVLVDHFESAVLAGKRELKRKAWLTEPYVRRLSRIAIRMLAARVLEDKQLIRVKPLAGAQELLMKAHKQFPQYFAATELDEFPEAIAETVLEQLRGEVTFRSLTNDMLGYFYENALVVPEFRRELGIYYTPRGLATRVLKRMPIEDIPADQRHVLDGTCGSGNLLLAAHERLKDLLPVAEGEKANHKYLVEHLWGVDKDEFATEVAGLSLLLFSLPFGDSWHVYARDFLALRPQELFRRRPRIIVGNPPFREERSRKGQRYQVAADVVERYVDWLAPGGLMGVILPESFLTNKSCRRAREKLFVDCDVMEVWQLPAGTIPDSTMEICVLIARKWKTGAARRTFPVRVDRVMARSPDKELFFKEHRSSFSFVLRDQGVWRSHEGRVMTVSQFESLWDRLCAVGTLVQRADVKNGIQPVGKAKLVTEPLGEGWKPWLSGARWLEPYLIDSKGQGRMYIRYPGNLHRPRLGLREIFERPKLLMNASRSRSNPWRVYAAIDKEGYYPNESLNCVVPRSTEVSLEELAAVLNHPIANAWVDSRNPARRIKINVIEAIPYPRLSSGMRRKVAEIVRRIARYKGRLLRALSTTEAADLACEVRGLVRELDEILFDAYGVEGQERKAVLDLFRGFQRPGREWTEVDFRPASEARGPGERPRRCWTMTSFVQEVRLDKGTIVLWVRGMGEDNPIEMGIPPLMPGWGLREDVAFRFKVPRVDGPPGELEPEALFDFELIPYSYLSEDELLERLGYRE